MNFSAYCAPGMKKAKNREIWKKLRLVVAHAAEVYIPLNINKSPFNVGLPIELAKFTPEQVLDLAERHGFDWSASEVDQLMELIGGQPYLVRLALYQIWYQNITLDELLHPFSDLPGIYHQHLLQQLWNLKQRPELLPPLKRLFQPQPQWNWI